MNPLRPDKTFHILTETIQPSLPQMPLSAYFAGTVRGSSASSVEDLGLDRGIAANGSAVRRVLKYCSLLT